jgi:hypothetical protein
VRIIDGRSRSVDDVVVLGFKYGDDGDENDSGDSDEPVPGSLVHVMLSSFSRLRAGKCPNDTLGTLSEMGRIAAGHTAERLLT